MNSGYQIIDLKSTAFTSQSPTHTISGIYSAINNSDKRIIINNFVYGGIMHTSSPCFMKINNENGSIRIGILITNTPETTQKYAEVDIYALTISSNDSCTLDVSVFGGGAKS